jgi:hypothetical protein
LREKKAVAVTGDCLWTVQTLIAPLNKGAIEKNRTPNHTRHQNALMTKSNRKLPICFFNRKPTLRLQPAHLFLTNNFDSEFINNIH